ncbi:Nramp family divalent metal transporter [Corynebacterium glyciniphilum]|uniref:Nramp family divalent metal transporter n=1 Tax=Corynebacterium glyciniphilum TaxID=1404244 RepID=UPI0026502570|nr:Nramp family divalent metal transporter [Corynebacterium glyciniphilum]MDN6706153.1 Nramp family divalent metal transporter [Corynebacterium glyciniphilum]
MTVDAADVDLGQQGARADSPQKQPRLTSLLGPAFVAAIAYVDPGNVAANLSAGAEYGYLLLWVLIVANLMAAVVQYLSAKLGLVTSRSLSATLADRFDAREKNGTVAQRRRGKIERLAYWGQAEVIAAATDVAEVVGGAIALNLLFGTPLVLGGVIVGVVSLGMLVLQGGRTQRRFEFVIMAFLLVITVGFLSGLFVTGLSVGEMVEGIVPRFQGTHSVVLAASMLGATVMPHAVYLHSGLVRDRRFTPQGDAGMKRHLAATKWDVGIALVVAGTVNIAMLCLAAQALRGVDGTDTIEGAHAAVEGALGPVIGMMFAVGLLASGLASTSVGCYAGDMVMRDLLKVRIPLLLRRLLTMLPALLILGAGVEPTWALVMSQVVLSVGIPFALVPLVAVTARSTVMGRWANPRALTVLAAVICAVIIALNVALIWLTLTGQA